MRCWLLRVLHNEIANAFRVQGQHPIQSLDALAEEPMDYRGQESANRESEEHELLRHWLEELEQRDPLGYQLVRERHVDGVHPKNLAAVYGRSAHWVSVHINRTLNDFRAWLVKHRGDDAASP